MYVVTYARMLQVKHFYYYTYETVLLDVSVDGCDLAGIELCEHNRPVAVQALSYSYNNFPKK